MFNFENTLCCCVECPVKNETLVTRYCYRLCRVMSCHVVVLCCVVLCCVVSCVLCCVVLCCRLSCCAELRCVVLEHTEF